MRQLTCFWILALTVAATVTACKSRSSAPPPSPAKTDKPGESAQIVPKRATPTLSPKAATPPPATTTTLKGTPMPIAKTPQPTTSTAATPPGAAAANPIVVIQTSMGKIEVELDPVRAPISTRNFLGYVEQKFYDGTIFHRVISNFMIQGGGLTADMQQKRPGPPIKNESGNGLSNRRGTIAMARTQDLDSATCQFYINVVDNPSLDTMRYAVFGKVTSGMDVVDKIRAVPTRAISPYVKDVPVQTVLIESVRLKQ